MFFKKKLKLLSVSALTLSSAWGVEQGIGISFFGVDAGDKTNLTSGISRTEGNLSLTLGPGAYYGYATDTYAASALISGSVYEILTPGTTDFTAIGAPDNNVGTLFVATGTGTGSGVTLKLLTLGWDGYGITTQNLAGLNDSSYGSSTVYSTIDGATTYSALKLGSSDNQFKLDLKLTNNGPTDVVLKDLYFDARNAYGNNHRDTLVVQYLAGDLIKGTGYANDSSGNSTVGDPVYAGPEKVLYTNTWSQNMTVQVKRGFGSLGGETILPAGGSMVLRFVYPPSGVRGTGLGQQQLDNILITVDGPDLDSTLTNTGTVLGLNSTLPGTNGVSFAEQYADNSGDGSGDGSGGGSGGTDSTTYTLAEIMDLRAGSSAIQVANGSATVELVIEQSSDGLQSWSDAGTATVTINADTAVKFFRFKMAD